MRALKSTTLTCLLDDPTMTTSFSEFLLQIQSGLPQGSLRTGLSVPSGSILMSTNSIESARYYRIVLLIPKIMLFRVVRKLFLFILRSHKCSYFVYSIYTKNRTGHYAEK